MEHYLKASWRLRAVETGLLVLMLSGILRSNGQISTACTSSALSTFTPCFNYLTGSSGDGSSPTEDCCNTLKSAMTDSMDCACLIVTGNVPVSIPFVRTLALSLPQQCNSGVPVQCKATGVPLPAPGPEILSPPAPNSPPPHHRPPRTPPGYPPAAPPRNQKGKMLSEAAVTVSVVKMEKTTSAVESPTTPPPTAAAAPPPFIPKATPADIRPVLVPSTSTSASSSSYIISSSRWLLLLFSALFINIFLHE